jgi:hypothetical protein
VLMLQKSSVISRRMKCVLCERRRRPSPRCLGATWPLSGRLPKGGVGGTQKNWSRHTWASLSAMVIKE